ncbi:MAG: pentapeptide repeat-containing protein [Leptolyngbyaceae cyanobacterium bins.59]|nr:pentapeptide repeat-containing protein [Leptolyngbyaceae cyanobacterium bins.59]
MDNPEALELSEKPISLLLKKLRQARHLTQKGLGQLLDPPVGQPTIAKWEKGSALPEHRYFPALAQLLDYKLEEFFALLGDDSAGEVKEFARSYDPRHLAMLESGSMSWNRWRKQNPMIVPDLVGAKPVRKDFTRIDLSNANLQGVDFSEAMFYKAKLLGANLQGATLRGANFNNADLAGANFDEADLESASLCYANLESASFQKTNLHWARFFRSTLIKANLTGADLKNADLRRSNLTEADFSEAILVNCLIYGTSVWNIKLDGATQSRLNLCPNNVDTDFVDDLETAYTELLKRRNRV